MITVAKVQKKKEKKSSALSTEQILRELYMKKVSGCLEKAIQNAPLENIKDGLIDIQTPLQVLQQPIVFEAIRRDDPWAAARLRGLEAAQKLLRMEGGCGDIEVVKRILGMKSREGVYKRSRKGDLIEIKTGMRGVLFPLWQFKSTGGVLDGLEPVLAKLRERGCLGWSILHFFLNPHVIFGDTGITPLQALQKGRLAEVLRAAELFGEEGAY